MAIVSPVETPWTSMYVRRRAADGASSISNTSPYGEVYSFFPLLLALGAYWGLLAAPGRCGRKLLKR
jgi:hypothetical protein